MEQTVFLRKEHHFLSSELYFNFCGFSKTMPFHSFGPAIRQHFVLHIILDGEGVYSVNQQKYHLKKGDLFLIRPGDQTFYRSDVTNPWVYAWLSFGGKEAEELIKHSPFKENEYTFRSNQLVDYSQLILACFDYAPDTLLNEIKLNALLYRFFEKLLVDGGKNHLSTPQNISRLTIEAIEYIQAHATEELTIQEVADALSVNRSHLSRTFHENIGVSVKEWLLGIRINRAAFLLLMSDDSVENIAFQSSFHSLVVFSRIFKKKTGETPTAYRKRASQKQHTNLSLESIMELLEQQAIVGRAT